MPLDGEPKNGDYVAYIEALVNRGARSPGQIAAGPRKRARWTDTLRPAGAAAEPAGLPDLPPGDGFDAPAVPAPARARGHGRGREPTRDQDGPTLAQAASQRKQGLGMIGVGAVLAVVALDMARDARAQAGGFEDFLPSLFLLLFAFIFLRAGLGARRRARALARPLPPLSTAPPSAGRRP